ncbi:MAG: hypothetical protein HQL99_13980 [Magnetococcales bacterium]|nr:hypothetical protein [Magnetococcales bacterium]
MHSIIMTDLFDIRPTPTRPVEPISPPSPIPPTRTLSAGRIQTHGHDGRVETFLSLLGKANEQPSRSARPLKRRTVDPETPQRPNRETDRVVVGLTP